MRRRVEVTPAARRDLKALPRDVLRRVDRAILSLADEPRPPGARKLEGVADLWRVREGDFRVVYRIEDAILVVLIVLVAHRRDVYTKLRRR